MDLVYLKFLAALVFLFLTLLFGLAPFLLLRCYVVSDSPRSPVHFLHALASGVLLATCLLHLLPESLEAVRDSMKPIPGSLVQQSPHTNTNSTSAQSSVDGIDKTGGSNVIDNDGMYPVAELIVALGFLFTYVVDNFIKTLQATKGRDFRSDFELDKILENTDETSDLDLSRRVRLSEENSQSLYRNNESHNRNPPEEDQGGSDGTIEKFTLQSMNSLPGLSQRCEEYHPLTEESWHGKKRANNSASKLRSAALVSALCIHGFFDGVILGLQTSRNVLLSLFLALCLHKSFVVVGLSLTLLHNRPKQSPKDICLAPAEMLYITLFALVAPLGLVFSSAFEHTAFDLSLSDENSDSSGVSPLPGCLQAFAVGTFMYVTFSEMGEHSRRENSSHVGLSRRQSLMRCCIGHVSLAVGFTFMAWLRSALGES